MSVSHKPVLHRNGGTDLAEFLGTEASANYRTIAFVSHASKILLRIILERIRIKTETEIADEQAGFRQEIKSRISEY